MTDHTSKLTERDVLEQATERLQPHLPFKADSYVCNQAQLIRLLLGVAATKNTLEAVCAELETSPCAATIRSYVNEQLTVEELPQLERAMNEALSHALAPPLFVRQREVAVEYHYLAYYG